MVSAVQSVIAKLLSPLWRKAEDEEDAVFYGAATEEVRNLQAGVVTQFCQDYGLIDDTIYFSLGVVLGGVPLHVGDRVGAIAVRDSAQGGWTALRVERVTDSWEENAGPQSDLDSPKTLIGTVTSCDNDGGFINHTTFFSRMALCPGFEPIKGDWVQAEYFICASQWSSQASSVAPLRFRRMDQVRVSNVCGRSGVLEDTVFFCLDSVLLPAGYQPAVGDQVSAVVLESSQSFYCWRALCMAPTQCSQVSKSPALELDFKELLEDKGGLLVTKEAQFGTVMLGSVKQLQLWIENQSPEAHRLLRCELAGWSSQEEFTLGVVSAAPPPSPTLPQPAAKAQTLHCGILTSVPYGRFGHSLLPRLVKPQRHTDGVPSEQEEEEVDGSVEPGVKAVDKDVEILPGEKMAIEVGFRAKSLGHCTELLLLRFPTFTIARQIEVRVSSEEESLLQPSAPFSFSSSTPKHTSSQVVTVLPGPAPLRLSKRHLPNFLGNYPIPKALQDCVEAQGDVLVTEPLLGQPLSLFSMRPRFSALLWLEELQCQRELQEFSLNGVLLRRGAVNLHLEVPGLTEGRPSLWIGDRVLLKNTLNRGMVMEYMAYVVEIQEEEVSLRVNTDFHHSYLGEPLDVEFTFNRVSIRRCHCALEQTMHFGENVLFPSSVTLQAPQWSGEWESVEQQVQEGNIWRDEVAEIFNTDMVSVATQTRGDSTDTQCRRSPAPGQFFNPLLNPAQRQAVKHILAGECRPTPYILFGPPGTGKTITLIEAILQVYHRLPGSRVLVCSPSNSAADLICLRLHHSSFLPAGSLARVNATYRMQENIPEVLRPYSRAGEDVRHASFHRIVVCTCSSAGMFYQIGLRVGHFTHVFIDEAGQATEPETLISLGMLSETDGQIVLAGDPRQLGPVVKSRLALAYGLGLSLLERLMALPLYCPNENGQYNPLLVTKLLYNYRSHEALLALPSRLFYSSELCVRAERAVVDSLCSWSRLPTKGFPLIFHGLRGMEMREGTNPSWFNPAEAVQVMLYCCQLAKRLYHPVAPTDIGIITPYRKQVEKIRVLLQRVGLRDIKVGSVEEFQGQESLVILLSTVRSKEVVLQESGHSLLGFLSNPKRFNVAITRPKALLVVVGNPHILVKDPCFCALLQYCLENEAYVGCDLPGSLRTTHRPIPT